jgi:hypothetical protein
MADNNSQESLDKAIAALATGKFVEDALRSQQAAKAYRSGVLRQYDRIRKQKGRGNDPSLAYDTGEFLESLVRSNVEVKERSIVLYSDLSYAESVLAIIDERSSIPLESDEQGIEELANIIGDVAEGTWQN